jgi:hypothetical protein
MVRRWRVRLAPSVKSPRLYILPLGDIPLDNASVMFTEPLEVAS